jgi:putative nucleotidyltransferase with HDIG domain
MDMNIPIQDLKLLGTGALLHDVGKVCISEDILKKPTSLTSEEYNEVKSHTEIGYQILLRSGVSEEAAQIALFHHEKCDGTGYNRKLPLKEIPFLSRIVTVADTYDAMSNDRVYRKKLSPDKVYKEIARLSGCHFDYDIAERFLRRIDLYPIGTGVILNTNHKGIVVSQNKLLPQSPIIRVFKDESDPTNPKDSTIYTDIDLTRTKYLFIKDTF